MTPQDWPAIWAGDEWRDDVTSWVTRALRRAGRRVAGEIEQPRITFWSTQLLIPTDRGRVWFKENNPGQSFEAALTQCLAGLVPGRVVDPIAVDAASGRLLSPDQGPTLRERDGGTEEDWVRVLTEFGALQRELSTHKSELTATGLPAMPAARTSAYVRQRCEELARRPAGDPRGVTAEQLRATHDALPQLEEACAALDASGVPDSLQHNDLHDNNAFPGVGDAPLRFFDLGDAVWAHPFAVLRVATGAMARVLGTAPDDLRVVRAVDAYLENWSDLAPLADLRALVPAAHRVAAIHRSLSWRRLLDQVPISAVDDPEGQDAESWWLQEFRPDRVDVDVDVDAQ